MHGPVTTVSKFSLHAWMSSITIRSPEIALLQDSGDKEAGLTGMGMDAHQAPVETLVVLQGRSHGRL